MRTTLNLDDSLLEVAMQAGPFNSKREAVDAGLRLIVCQAAMGDLLKWRAKPMPPVEESTDSRLKSTSAPKTPTARKR